MAKISVITAVKRLINGDAVFYLDYSATYQVESITINGGYHSLKLRNGRKIGNMANDDGYLYNSQHNAH